jgi:hypothetical protein
MSVSERAAPVMAALGAVSTLLCCLPLSFAGAVGLAGLSAAALEHRSWLLVGSVVLLAVGFVQVYRRPAQCAPKSVVSVTILWLSLALVAVVFLMPQLVATLLADWLG